MTLQVEGYGGQVPSQLRVPYCRLVESLRRTQWAKKAMLRNCVEISNTIEKGEASCFPLKGKLK